MFVGFRNLRYVRIQIPQIADASSIPVCYLYKANLPVTQALLKRLFRAVYFQYYNKIGVFLVSTAENTVSMYNWLDSDIIYHILFLARNKGGGIQVKLFCYKKRVKKKINKEINKKKEKEWKSKHWHQKEVIKILNTCIVREEIFYLQI